MKELPIRVDLKLSIRRALLGAVTKNLVAVTCGLSGTEIRINAYYKTTLTRRLNYSLPERENPPITRL